MTQYITIKQSTNPQKVITVVSNSQQFNLSIKQAEPEIISELYPFLLVPVTPVKGIDYFDGYTPIKGIDYFDGTNGIDGTDGTDGVGIPIGGTTGQVLAKKTNTDYDTEWITSSAGGVTSFNSRTGIVLPVSGDYTADKITETTTLKFFLNTERTKLAGIADNANNYTHPANHSPSIITQDTNNRFVTDAEKSAWNGKQDALGFIPYNSSNPAGYISSETSHADVVVDGDFTSQGIMLRGASSGTYSILTDNSSNWNTAFTNSHTHVNKSALDLVSGTNTGDETDVTIKSKLGITTLSGSNTGDQDLSGYVLKTTTVNSKALNANIVLSTADIADSTNKRYVTDAHLTLLWNTSGTNSGDNAVNSLYSGLATSKQDTLVSGTNIKTVNSTSLLGSGDITVQATLVSGTNIKTVNGISLLGSGDITISGESGSEEEIVVLKTIPTSNSSTSLADCGELFFTADAGKTYLIEVFLVWDTTATTVGIKASLLASASVTTLSGHFITDAAAGTPDSSSFNNSDVVTTTSASPFTTNNFGCIRAILINSSSSNTIKVRFAAETTGTITIKSGSSLRYRKLN